MFHQLSQHGIQHSLFLLSLLVAGGPPPENTPQASTAPELERAIVIRLSESMFQPPNQGKVDHASVVDRTVLGSAVSGTCRTTGRTYVEFLPDEDDGSLQFVFDGVSFSQTQSNNGPAVIHNATTTRFRCTKRVTFDLENGFHASPSVAKATTQMRNEGITTRRRGFIGRMVRNVAARRVEDSQAEAAAITNRDTERDVSRGFDAAIDEQLALLNKQLDLPRLLAAIFGSATKNNYCVRSNAKYLEICFHDADKGAAHKLAIPQNQVADAPIQIWARSALFDVKVRAAIQAYSVAEKAIEKLTPTKDLAKQAGLAGTSMESSDVEVIDGWIIFAWKPEKESLASLAAGEGEDS